VTQKSVANPGVVGSGKVVVFGLDSNWRPHAGWFPHAQTEPARTAAKQLRLNVIEVPNGTAADLIAKVPAGQIHAAGPAMVPPIREDLYEKIVATFNRRGEAGNERDAPILTDLPETWAAIKPGHLVLAQDSLIDGWYEAIVVGRTGDKLTLRSRDYPGYPNFTVPVTAVGLVGPAGS
jgi:hypothetical protein